MKNKLLLITTLVIALTANTYASSSHKMPMKEKGKTKVDHSKMDHTKMKADSNKKSKRKTLSDESKKEIIAVLDANETLHNSFFKYEADKVEESAIKLDSTISLVKDSDITKLLKYSKTILSKIKAVNTRDINNQHYHMVSMALIHIVNTYDIGGKYNSYSCPMVKKKWLQSSKESDEINNPYAPDMPHCGRKESKH
jgi:hypothetical protein